MYYIFVYINMFVRTIVFWPMTMLRYFWQQINQNKCTLTYKTIGMQSVILKSFNWIQLILIFYVNSLLFVIIKINIYTKSDKSVVFKTLNSSILQYFLQ